MKSQRGAVSFSGGLVLAAGILLSLVCGALYAWSVFVLPLEAQFGWTRAATGLTFTLAIIFFSVGMSLGGLLVERVGPRLSILCGGLFLSGGLFWASQAQSLGVLYLSYGVLTGFGIGIANIVPSIVCLRWYPQRSGLIYGVLALSLAIGSFVFGSLIATPLIHTVGITRTLQWLALLFFVLLCVAALFMGFPPADPASVSTADTDTAEGLTPWKMLHARLFHYVWLWAFCLQVGGLMVVGHLVPMAVHCGMALSQAGILLGVYAIANGIGRVLLGYILDAYGMRVSLVLAAAGMGCGLMLVACLPEGQYLCMAGAVAMVGAAFGGTIPQMSALVRQFFGSRHLGVNIGISTSTLLAAALTGPSLAGLVFNTCGGYTPALWIAASLSIVGMGAATFLCALAQNSGYVSLRKEA